MKQDTNATVMICFTKRCKVPIKQNTDSLTEKAVHFLLRCDELKNKYDSHTNYVCLIKGSDFFNFCQFLGHAKYLIFRNICHTVI